MVPRTFRYSDGEAIKIRQVKHATEIPEEILSPEIGHARDVAA